MALENVSAQTGFTIVKYGINPGKSVDTKLTLQVTGVGDAQAFLNFMNNYNFSGGRFITSDVIDYSAAQTTSTTLNLTFYSKKTSSLSEVNKKLTPQDIALLREIQNKTFIVVKQEEATESGSYTTKDNPF